MNGYVCFYRDDRVEVHADSSYGAQQEALVVLGKKYPRRKIRGWEIAVNLAEIDGKQVTHTAAD